MRTDTNILTNTHLAEKHAFSSKERDVETGLSYFGARYYSSDLSIWLSVDPMSGKYPSTSPYAYCRNNPIVLVDIDGEFDTRSEARQYRKEHHTGGRIFTNASSDNFSGDYSIINKKARLSYTRPDYDYAQSGIKLIGLSEDGVVSSPLARDPRTRRERFEDFEMKATQKGGAIGQGFATAFPISSTVNDITVLKRGENMFGEKATQSDKVWAIIGLSTLGAGDIVKGVGKLGAKTFSKVGSTIENVGYALNIRSDYLTARKKMKNGK